MAEFAGARQAAAAAPGLRTLVCSLPEPPHLSSQSPAPLAAGRTTEAPLPPPIPAPLAGKNFLRASHFQLACDHRPQGSADFSAHRTDYPPRWGSHQREPILPPKCAGVLNQDMDGSWDTRSETSRAYPAWPLGQRPQLCLPASHLQTPPGPRQTLPSSVTRDSYPSPASVPRARPHRVDKWDDSCPSGDKEKIHLPESLYQQSYLAHRDVPPTVKAPSQHLGPFASLGHSYDMVGKRGGSL